jgi:hypothetical protein
MNENENPKSSITVDDLLKWVNGHIDRQPDPGIEARMQADIQSENSRIIELLTAVNDIEDLVGGVEIRDRHDRDCETRAILDTRSEVARIMGIDPVVLKKTEQEEQRRFGSKGPSKGRFD